MGIKSIPILKFMYSEEFKYLNDDLVMSLSHYGRIENCPTIAELLKRTASLELAFIVTFVKERQDLIELAMLLKMRKREMKHKKIKIVVINFGIDQYFERVLTELGLYEFTITSKEPTEIKSRLDHWLMFFSDEIRSLNSSSALREDLHIIKGSNFEEGSNKKNTLQVVLPPEEELRILTQDICFNSFLIQNEKLIVCQLDDFHDDVVFFLTEKINIRPDKKIEISFLSEYLSKKTNLKIEGIVSEVKESENGSQLVSIKLTKRNSLELSAFLHIREERQANITKFLNRVKGF